VLNVREYIDAAGRSPFTKWLRALNVQAAAKIATALERIAAGNLSNVKTVGNGVLDTELILAPGTEFTSDGTATGLLFCSPAARRSASSPPGKGELGDYRNRKTQERTRCH
jgi:putative component of toxin-antitoxin plasmid stabilization module